jgi:hypothetical protein
VCTPVHIERGLRAQIVRRTFALIRGLSRLLLFGQYEFVREPTGYICCAATFPLHTQAYTSILDFLSTRLADTYYLLPADRLYARRSGRLRAR